MRSEKDVSIEFLKTVGDNIKRKRQEKKMSLEKLGLEIGLTRMQVHRIENGYNITMTTFLKIFMALNMKPEELIRFDYKFRKEDLEKLVNNSKGNKRRPKK